MSGNNIKFNELTSEQARQFTDTVQAYRAWRQASLEFEHRYRGSMRWVTKAGRDYLMRKLGPSERSLGPRSAKTEEAYTSFQVGREQIRDRLDRLSSRLDSLAPVNRAVLIARFPAIAGRIIRELDKRHLLGSRIFLVGTNALYAYEALAGVQFSAEVVSTQDLDLLWSGRNHLELSAPAPAMREASLVGLLRKIDRTFATQQTNSFRMVNNDGYIVDFIRPEAKEMERHPSSRIPSGKDTDIQAAPIYGLAGLVNSPRIEQTVIAESGYPLQVVVPDPRSFALHKLWLSVRTDRNPVKKIRDRDQGEQLVRIIRERLPSYDFDAAELSALPSALKEVLPKSEAPSGDGEGDNLPTPKW